MFVQKCKLINMGSGETNHIISASHEINADMWPEVAVVILNWNGQKFLEKFLPSVMESTYPNKRIIVADNASTDDSLAFLKAHYPQVELIIHNSNLGFAKGYNASLKDIDSPYYVLLNSDVEVTPKWIEPVIRLMESDQDIAACQPKILSFSDTHLFEYAGASGGWIDRFGYPFARGRVFDVCEEDHGQYDHAEACFWASGAALFIRSAEYRAAEGLDEHFFAHQEEVDLCWRLQLAGKKIYVQPASTVYHVGGGTLPMGNKRKLYLNFRNSLIMLYKNLPASEALIKIPFRMLLDGAAAWRSLLTGSFGDFTAVIKAHFHFIRWLLFDQKKSVFPRKGHAVNAGWYKGSIVFDYFIKKKRTFLQIIENK